MVRNCHINLYTAMVFTRAMDKKFGILLNSISKIYICTRIKRSIQKENQMI